MLKVAPCTVVRSYGRTVVQPNFFGLMGYYYFVIVMGLRSASSAITIGFRYALEMYIMYNFSTVIAIIILLFFFKAAYETIEEAREAIFELGKEVTRGFIQSAPRGINLITRCKRVGQKINS